MYAKLYFNVLSFVFMQPCVVFPYVSYLVRRSETCRGRGASFEVGTHLCRRGCELFRLFRYIPAPYLEARFVERRRRVAVLHAGVHTRKLRITSATSCGGMRIRRASSSTSGVSATMVMGVRRKYRSRIIVSIMGVSRWSASMGR